MHARCARQLCDSDAVAVCAIDPSSTTVLVFPLETSVVGSPLCRRHLDGLQPPEGWQLRDRRELPTGTSPEPSVPSDSAERHDDGDFEALLDASSPLLSRAFRTARPG
jgi:hypothetical protein